MPIADWIPSRSNFVSGIIGGLFGGGLIGPIVSHLLSKRRERTKRAIQLADLAAAKAAGQIELIANRKREFLDFLHLWRADISGALPSAMTGTILTPYREKKSQFIAQSKSIRVFFVDGAAFERLCIAIENLESAAPPTRFAEADRGKRYVLEAMDALIEFVEST